LSDSPLLAATSRSLGGATSCTWVLGLVVASDQAAKVAALPFKSAWVGRFLCAAGPASSGSLAVSAKRQPLCQSFSDLF
jgi:hypothetical protein